VSYKIQNLMLQTIAIKILIITLKWVIQKTIVRLICPRSWRTTFEVSEEGVWGLSVQLVLTICMIFLPFAMIFYPFLLILVFKFYKLQLFGFSKKPKISAPDESTSVLLFELSFANSLISKLIYVAFFYDPLKIEYYQDRNGNKALCGPFYEGQTALTAIRASAAQIDESLGRSGSLFVQFLAFADGAGVLAFTAFAAYAIYSIFQTDYSLEHQRILQDLALFEAEKGWKIRRIDRTMSRIKLLKQIQSN